MAVPTVASGCANSAKSGVEALEAGDYKEAQAQFEKLTEEKDKKKSAEGYRGLAMTYYEQEEYSSALDRRSADKQFRHRIKCEFARFCH